MNFVVCDWFTSLGQQSVFNLNFVRGSNHQKYPGLSIPDTNPMSTKSDGMESPSKRAQRFGTKTRQSRQSSPMEPLCTPQHDQRGTRSSSSCAHGDFFSSNDEVVIFSCITQPILVTFNTASYYHTIWVLRRDQKEIRKRHCGSTTKQKKAFRGHRDHGGNSSDDDFDGASKMLHSSLMHPRDDFNPLDPDDTAHSNKSRLQNQVFLVFVRMSDGGSVEQWIGDL